MDVICFQQEARWYGLFVGAVADLVPTVVIDPLREPSPPLYGVSSYRGRPVLAVRLGRLLPAEDGEPRGGEPEPARPRETAAPVAHSLLVVGPRERLLGLPADCVRCILDVRQVRIARERCDEPARRACRFRLRYCDLEVHVLDVTYLVRLVELAIGRSPPIGDRVRSIQR